MRLLAGLLSGAAVALVVLAVAGLDDAVLRRRPRSAAAAAASRPGLFRHFEAEGIPARRGLQVSLAAGLATATVLWAATASAVLALVAGAGVAVLPSSWYAARGQRREKEMRAAWPDALRGLIGALNAGRSLHEALVDLSSSGPVPLRRVFARYTELTRLAVPESEALGILRDELADAVSDRVFEVLIVASDKGSRIALKVLQDVADSATADVQLVERVATASTEHRLNAYAVMLVPWITLVLLTARPGEMRDFYASPAGGRVLVVGAVMSLGGMAIFRRLARSQPEPRVFLTAPERDAG